MLWIIFSCNIPVVLDKYEGAGVVQSNTTNIIWCSSLLIRLNISALSPGHHQVSSNYYPRPDDDPVIGPKHVVLSINYYRLVVFDCTTPAPSCYGLCCWYGM